jgi:PAS domain S-box-containing protein
MADTVRVLIVEDSPDDAELMLLELQREGYAPAARRVESAQEMRAALAENPWDVILSDYTLPQFGAVAALGLAKEVAPDVPFVVVSGTVGEAVAVGAMRAGASDYVLKQTLARLGPAVRRELREAENRRGRRRAEQQAYRLAAIVQSSEDAIIAKTLDGIITDWNPGAERLYGYAAAEVVGRPISVLVPPDRQEELAGIMAGLRRGERIAPFETVRLRKDGSPVHVALTISPILDGAGRTVGASKIARDITERRLAERRVAESHRRFEQTLDAVSDLFAAFDREWNYTYLNRKAASFTGQGPGELVGRNLWEQFPEAVGSTFHRELLQAAASGTVRRFEAYYPWLDRWYEHRAYPHPEGLSLFSTDITERKQSEQRLARDALILSNVRDAVSVTDLDGVVTYWNEGAARLFGWTAEEMIGRPMADRVPAAERDAMRAAVAAIREGKDFAGEWLDYRKDGSRVWIDARVGLIRDEEGHPQGILGVSHDITERKEAEARLRASEADFRTLAEAVPQIVWVTRPDGWNVYFNQRWVDYTGLTLEESLGHGWNKPFHPDDRQRAWDAWQRATATVGPYSLECRLRRADGEYRWWLIRGAPLRDAAGTVVKWFGTCTDIDDLKRAEAERGELLRRLQLHLERMPLACVYFDRQVRIQEWNPAAERIFGYKKEEVLGRSAFATIVPDSARAAVEENVRRVQAGDMAANHVNENRTKDGRLILCEWFNTPLTVPAGEVVGCLSLAADITERRQLEEQFRQAQKMEAVGRLAGGVAHDFNNLLTIINGYSDLVANGLRPGDPMRQLVQEITNAGERAAGLTRQLLAFSRKTVLEPKVLDLNAQVGEMEKLLLRLIGEDIDLATRLDPDLGRVKADAGQLEQAVVNLCVNARDAMPQGGKITVETRNADLDATYVQEHADGVQPGEYVLLAVTDTGHGMDAATQARIFEPFFTTKEAGKGTGLGLAMVFGFVKQSGGHVAVCSEPGRGTTFKIYLPRVRGAVSSGKSHPGLTALPNGKETILLVEDEDGVRALALHLLQTCGYTVLEASHGKEALRVAERHAGPVHLLVTDVVMPQGMGGRQVAEAVRALHPETRVLFVSGYTDDAVVRHGVLEEKTNFLQKPFSPASLTLKVREVLDQAPPAPGEP